jgi:hypothetical protein
MEAIDPDLGSFVPPPSPRPVELSKHVLLYRWIAGRRRPVETYMPTKPRMDLIPYIPNHGSQDQCVRPATRDRCSGRTGKPNDAAYDGVGLQS